MQLIFYKYQGTGNDFIIVDNRQDDIHLNTEQIQHLCNRRFGIGADGLMVCNNKEGYDFEMIYYNADGNESSLCGNGARCMARFVYDLGLHKNKFHFLAIDGEHEATIEDHNWVHLKMKDVLGIERYNGDCIVNTGSPHYIKTVSNLQNYDIVKAGKEIRYSDEFAKDGINVNFVEENIKEIYVRTYERGVENETLSCGTGVTAAAIVFSHNDNGFNRIEVATLGGHLAVEYDKTGEEKFENIWLCGPAVFVFKGETKI